MVKVAAAKLLVTWNISVLYISAFSYSVSVR